jgi:hypothetical protein
MKASASANGLPSGSSTNRLLIADTYNQRIRRVVWLRPTSLTLVSNRGHTPFAPAGHNLRDVGIRAGSFQRLDAGVDGSAGSCKCDSVQSREGR